MPLRVAVVYNTKDHAPAPVSAAAEAGVDDLKAELDTMETVCKYAEFIRALGHEVVFLHGDDGLVAALRKLAAEGKPVDICWNTCEGYRGLDREAQVPAMLEMCGMPYSFSRPMAMALSLDKAMTKRILAFHGIPTPAFQEFSSPDEPLCPALQGKWPLFVKPNAEGTGMGITAKSLCHTEPELREQLHFMLRVYGQTALVEEFIPGRDVTCGIVGNLGSKNGVHVLEINEVDYAHTKVPDDLKTVSHGSIDNFFYCRSVKALTGADFQAFCPARLPPEVTEEVKRLTVETYRVCMGRDGSRVDFRIDTRGGKLRPVVLEINEIPGMTFESDLTICAEGQGFSHKDLVQNIFAAACERYGLDPAMPPGTRWAPNWPPLTVASAPSPSTTPATATITSAQAAH